MNDKITLSIAQLEILLPNGCRNIKCNDCPIDKDTYECYAICSLL